MALAAADGNTPSDALRRVTRAYPPKLATLGVHSFHSQDFGRDFKAPYTYSSGAAPRNNFALRSRKYGPFNEPSELKSCIFCSQRRPDPTRLEHVPARLYEERIQKYPFTASYTPNG